MGEMLCFSMIMQGYIQQESQRKKILDLSCSILPHPPYFPDLAPSDFYLFPSLQNALNEKKFSQVDQMKTFMENLLRLKPTVFYLRGINKQSEELQEVTQNHGEYTID